MSEHALLSPSSANRWMACTPSARLEEKFPDTNSEAAKEGTLAHYLAEQKLRLFNEEITKKIYNSRLKEISLNPLYDTSMLEPVEDYVNFVIEELQQAKKTTKDALLIVEQKLDLTDFIKEGFGTSDATIIADNLLIINDLKFGKGVKVSAEENKQMMLYALGAFKSFEMLYNFTNIKMNIIQPRLNSVSSYYISIKDLQKWADTELLQKAALAFDGLGKFVAGDHCRFCRAKVSCKALAEYNLSVVESAFQGPYLLSDVELINIFERASGIINWLNSISNYALSEALNGKNWPGYKLVEGKSNRKYLDEDLVAKRLKENNWSENEIYTRKLLGITAMEKVLTKKVFTNLLSDLIEKPQGSPALVPESDPRKIYEKKTDFKIEEEEI